MEFSGRLVLIRHGQTEWSVSGQHTGRSDIPLTEHGRFEATEARTTLEGWEFSAVFSSPLQRAAETAEIVGLAPPIQLDDRLQEWDYGDVDGKRTVEMRETIPGWSVWTHPDTTAESVDDVGARIDSFLNEALPALGAEAAQSDVAIFAHGHLLAVFIARWLGLDAIEGRRFKLATATVSLLDFHREDRVLRALNHRCGEALHA